MALRADLELLGVVIVLVLISISSSFRCSTKSSLDAVEFRWLRSLTRGDPIGVIQTLAGIELAIVGDTQDAPVGEYGKIPDLRHESALAPEAAGPCRDPFVLQSRSCIKFVGSIHRASLLQVCAA